MDKLLVISEPYFDINIKGTRNNALNSILKAYTRYFEEVICVVPSRNQIEEIYRNEKIIYYSIRGYDKTSIRRLLFILKRARTKKKLLQIINKEKPTIIQLRIPSLFTQLLYSSVKNLKIPLTTYIAGEWDKALVLNYPKFPFIRYVADFLFISQYKLVRNTVPICTGDQLKERLLRVNPYAYAYYSTTHENIVIKEIKPIFYNLLIIGRLEKLKRVDDAIRALSELKKNDENYKLTILGDGVEREYLQSLVNQLGLEGNVNFLGHVSDSEKLKEIFIEHDILLHTSLSEGTTKVLPEAMSYGMLPIAVKNVGSNNYILSEGRGYLVNPMSPKEISSIIIYFNQLPFDQKKSRIDKGYEYASKHTIYQELDRMWNYVKNAKI